METYLYWFLWAYGDAFRKSVSGLTMSMKKSSDIKEYTYEKAKIEKIISLRFRLPCCYKIFIMSSLYYSLNYIKCFPGVISIWKNDNNKNCISHWYEIYSEEVGNITYCESNSVTLDNRSIYTERKRTEGGERGWGAAILRP